MAAARLLLYCDSDYIIPVVDKGDGYYEAFRGTDDGRIWLYFYTPADSTGIEYGRSFKASYGCGRPAYLGDIWRKIASGERYSTPVIDALPYSSLLNNSGIVAALRDFYSAGGSRKEVDIPTVYIFAGNIPDEARKKFIAYMQDQSFATWRFSDGIEIPALQYMRQTRPDLRPEFGQKVVIYESSGGDMLMRGYAYDGTEFLPLEEERRLEGMGENPLRAALVKIVLGMMQHTHNFLRDDDIQRETAYQMQFVDEWLSQRRDPSFGISFHYSSDPDTVYPCIVNNTQLNSIRDAAVSEIIQQMVFYRNKVAANDMLQCVLLGDAFSDEEFASRCINNIGGNRLVTVITPVRIPEVLSLYGNLPQAGQVEKLADFDKIRNHAVQARHAIDAWISNASRIRRLADTTQTLLAELTDEAQRYAKSVEKAGEEVKRVLQRPGGKFDEARAGWQRFSPARNPLQQYSAAINEHAAELEACRPIFDETNKFDGARAIIDRIRRESLEINQLVEGCRTVEAAYLSLGDIIEHYEQVYPQYCELLKQFKREGNQVVKRRILKQISDEDLTLEELPVIELDELIEVRLEAKVEKVRMGLFKSKRVLTVTITLPDGAKLPCNSVLVIQEKYLAVIEERYIRAEYDKGESGPFVYTADLPLPQCDKASRLRIYFKPHPAEAIGINSAFVTKDCEVSL